MLDFCKLISLYSTAIVLNNDLNCIRFFQDFDTDYIVLSEIVYAVGKIVLHQRLNGKLRNNHAFKLLSNGKAISNRIWMAHHTEITVFTTELQFAFQGYLRLIRNIVSQQAAKFINNIRKFFLALHNRIHTDKLQSVIHKMRINLGLQSPHIGIFLTQL